jgi:hypothetical protein
MMGRKCGDSSAEVTADFHIGVAHLSFGCLSDTPSMEEFLQLLGGE